MKYLYQFTVIAATALVGEVIHYLLPIPIPSSIYGIILLFILLQTGAVKVDSIRDISNILIDAMPLMFIAPAVALINEWEALSSNLAAYVLIPVISTVLVMAASGRVTQWLIRRKKHGGEEK